MNDPSIDPIAPDLDSLLDAERSRYEIPSASHERMWNVLESRIAAVPTAAPTLPAHRTNGLWRWVSGAFLSGALVGIAGHSLLRRPPAPRVVTVIREVRVPALIAPPVIQSALPPALSPTPATIERHHGAPVTSPALTSDRDVTLEQERVLLETARTALERGQSVRALDAINESSRRFPHGRLQEELESLRVQALVDAERFDDARAFAARFSQRFPQSMQRATVDAAIRSIP